MSIVGFGMSEENTETVLKHPLVMLCSDGVALAPYGSLNRGVPHPRNYGAFPRFLRLYVRDKRLLSLPEAIKKMTSLPAAKMKLKDRGSIKKGNFADLVIFDPEIISDKATYTEPKQYPRASIMSLQLLFGDSREESICKAACLIVSVVLFLFSLLTSPLWL